MEEKLWKNYLNGQIIWTNRNILNGPGIGLMHLHKDRKMVLKEDASIHTINGFVIRGRNWQLFLQFRRISDISRGIR